MGWLLLILLVLVEPALAQGVTAGNTSGTASAMPRPITGAGGTFPAAIYTKWGNLAGSAIGMDLKYNAIGSGGGQQVQESVRSAWRSQVHIDRRAVFK